MLFPFDRHQVSLVPIKTNESVRANLQNQCPQSIVLCFVPIPRPLPHYFYYNRHSDRLAGAGCTDSRSAASDSQADLEAVADGRTLAGPAAAVAAAAAAAAVADIRY